MFEQLDVNSDGRITKCAPCSQSHAPAHDTFCSNSAKWFVLFALYRQEFLSKVNHVGLKARVYAAS